MGARRSTIIWVLSTAAAIGGFVLIATQVRLPSDAVPTPAMSPVRVTFSPIDRDLALRQQLELFDPSPLILPNPYSAVSSALPSAFNREPGLAMGVFTAPARFGESTPLLTVHAEVPAPTRPIDGLMVGAHPALVDSIGERDVVIKALVQRTIHVEITRPDTGEALLIEDLTIEPRSRPETELPGPAELLLAVDRAGIVAPPIIVTGTGSENWDGFLRNDLARVSRLGQRLPSGVYRIRLGP